MIDLKAWLAAFLLVVLLGLVEEPESQQEPPALDNLGFLICPDEPGWHLNVEPLAWMECRNVQTDETLFRRPLPEHP